MRKRAWMLWWQRMSEEDLTLVVVMHEETGDCSSSSSPVRPSRDSSSHCRALQITLRVFPCKTTCRSSRGRCRTVHVENKHTSSLPCLLPHGIAFVTKVSLLQSIFRTYSSCWRLQYCNLSIADRRIQIQHEADLNRIGLVRMLERNTRLPNGVMFRQTTATTH